MNKIVIFVILLFMIVFTVPCCSSDYNRNQPEQSKNAKELLSRDREYNQAEDSADGVTITWGYHPLTYGRFVDFRNNTQAFTIFSLEYRKYMNHDVNNRPNYYEFFGIQTGDFFQVTSLSAISEFGSGLVIIDDINMTRENPRRYFSKAGVNIIFDYLESHQDFFFNGDEFEGLDDPYISRYGRIGNGNYQFIMMICDPVKLDLSFTEEYEPVWAISKCVDEYPAPDHPLYGLFQLLENDFIDQFE